MASFSDFDLHYSRTNNVVDISGFHHPVPCHRGEGVKSRIVLFHKTEDCLFQLLLITSHVAINVAVASLSLISELSFNTEISRSLPTHPNKQR